MSPPKAAVTTTEIYDQALKYARDFRLPPGTPQPAAASTWLPENIACIERYREWLSGGGTSSLVIRLYHIPMAGHVFSLNHKPSRELDLDQDLQPAMNYILAKGHGTSWTDNCRHSLLKFRRFLLHERGQVEVKARPYDPGPHTQGLPEWLVSELERYQRVCQRNWRPARLEENIRRFWSGHLRVWRFLCEQCGVKELADVRRKHLYDYAEQRLSIGKSVSTTNADLRSFRGFMIFLQEQEYSVPQALLRVHGLKQHDRLPKYLTDEQVRQLRDDFEGQVQQAQTCAQRRDALLTRAAFYLLWQGGLRKGEVEELRLEDLDLAGRRLSVRNGKGLKDRTVYLTETSLAALRAYLAVRGPGPTDHVFLYRNQPVGKDLIHGRLKAAGERAGVQVHAHRLRHTAATQLLNAGCPVTSIQQFLGHKKLNTTMVYARAHDKTVEADYFAAMSRIETRLSLAPAPETRSEPVPEEEREQLLALTEQLTEPELSFELRLMIVGQMRGLLFGGVNGQGEPIFDPSSRTEWIPPPRVPAMAEAPSI
jgi:site-specific recombinase XerD